MRRISPALLWLPLVLLFQTSCSGDTGMGDPAKVSMPPPSPTPEIYRPLVNEAVGAGAAGRYDEARRRYNEIIAKDPGCAEADYCRGEIAELDKNYKAAIEFYDKALAKNPRLETAYNDRGNCHRALGDQDKAISDYSIAMLLGPGPVHWVCRAQSYLAKKEFNKAMEDATVAISKDPNYDYAFYSRAIAWEGLKNFAQAEVDYGKAIEVTGEKARYLFYRGSFFLRRNNPERARADFVAAAAAMPDAGSYYCWIGQADMEMYDFEKARESFTSYLKMSEAANKPDNIAGAKRWLQRADEGLYDLAHKPENKKYQWAIACSAQLFAQNGEGLCSLSGMEPNEANIEAEKRLLSEWWGVTSREALLAVLAQQDRSGHNFSWKADCNNRRNPAVYLSSMIVKAEEGERMTTRMDLVSQYGDKFGERGILAWDLCRNICLCRWGYRVGWLTEDETYARIMPYARRLQSLYASWQQMGEEYLVGRHYWDARIYEKGLVKSEKNLHQLLTNTRSPWVYLPWNLDLN